MTMVGVISDTHGLLRPEALDSLAGSDLIIHAGDIGPKEILDRLAEFAPVTAVRGNVDRDPWCADLRTEEVIGSRRPFGLCHSRSGHDATGSARGRI